MGVKGFQKGHIVSQETRAKISKANNGNFFAICDYCSKKYHTKLSAFVNRKRHFCCRDCYSKYRAELLPKEEQHAYGTGYSQEERIKRKKAREIFNHYARDKHIEKQPCELCEREHNASCTHEDCFNIHKQWLESEAE